MVTFPILLLSCVHLVSENESQQTAQCERRVCEMNLQSSSGVAQSTPGIATV